MGAKKEEAFFVNCDRSTMTDDDILKVGSSWRSASARPARPSSSILRIGQWMGGSSVAEL